MIVARFDPNTGRYVVPADGERASMSFTHPFAAARVGLVIAGDLPCTTSSTPSLSSMHTFNATETGPDMPRSAVIVPGANCESSSRWQVTRRSVSPRRAER